MMQTLGPVSGCKLTVGGTTFLRLDNGKIWIELDHDEEDDYTYVYSVSDRLWLEQQYRDMLAYADVLLEK